jgi:hypothetical protein
MIRQVVLLGCEITFLAIALPGQQASAQTTYTLKATPKTVAWGD